MTKQRLASAFSLSQMSSHMMYVPLADFSDKDSRLSKKKTHMGFGRSQLLPALGLTMPSLHPPSPGRCLLGLPFLLRSRSLVLPLFSVSPTQIPGPTKQLSAPGLPSGGGG